MGRDQGRHDQDGAVQPGRAAGRAATSIEKAEAEIAAGKLNPFTGPMKDNQGKQRLAAGQTITDDALSKMDYYVEGVEGTLPSGG